MPTALATFVNRAAAAPPRAHVARIAGFALVAVVALFLGVFAIHGHVWHGPATVSSGAARGHVVTVTATPSNPAPVDVLALAGVVFGGLSALASVGSVWVAYLGIRRAGR